MIPIYKDLIGSAYGDLLDDASVFSFNSFFDIDIEKYKVVGIKMVGTNDLNTYLFCIDKSQNNKKIIIKCNKQYKLQDFLKRFQIVLFDRIKKYNEDDFSEEININEIEK